MTYPFLIVLAILPSFIWLLYFLRKDVHPESNQMVLKIFLYGILSAALTVFIMIGFSQLITICVYFIGVGLISLLITCFGGALIEELAKYLVVKYKVLSDPEFDEPLDIMLYMIISALGFAALENLLFFLSSNLDLGQTFVWAGFRFISATFLHALASASLGFFLALGFFENKKKYLFLFVGFTIAVISHGLFNLVIEKLSGYLTIILVAIIIISLTLFVLFGFKKLKKIKSVCKI